MTQFLVEEACFAAFDLYLIAARSGDLEKKEEGERLVARHAELRAMKEQMDGVH